MSETSSPNGDSDSAFGGADHGGAASEPTRYMPRKRWLAVVFSLIAPGLGHLYDGLPKLALVFWLVASLVSLLTVRMVLQHGGRFQLLGLILVAWVIPIAVAWDAARRARRFGSYLHVRWYSRWYVCAIIAVGALSLSAGIQRRYLMAHVMRTYHLPTTSMSPLLLSGDFIVSVPLRGDPGRGEVVLYGDGYETFVKRIVGVPGDTIRMISDTLYVNQQRVNESYARQADSDLTDPNFAWQRDYILRSVDRSHYAPSLENWGPLLVPQNQYFVLGDNRGNSIDSRYSGFVTRAHVYSHPTIVYFSRDAEQRRVRWHRIGLTIQ